MKRFTRLDATPNACGPLALRDLTGLSDQAIAKCCRLRGWQPGRGMPISNILVAAAHLGARFDHVDVPERNGGLADLMGRTAWRARLTSGVWLVCVDEPVCHVFGMLKGEFRGVVRAQHVVAPVTALFVQGR